MTAICRLRCAVSALVLLSMEATAEEPLTTRCESGPLMAAFAGFFETGRMPQELSRFLADVTLNKIEPYKAFDNVYYVGICWVSAWLLTSSQGHVLIDTLYGPYADQLLTNIRALGFAPKDIKLVVITHGHRDHAGGAARLKSSLSPETRFAMTREGWREAAETAAASVTSPSPWTMIEPDLVLTDNGILTAGGITIQAFETPGHTMGTASFAYDAHADAQLPRAHGWRAGTQGNSGTRTGGSLHRQRQAHSSINRASHRPDRVAPDDARLLHRPGRSQGALEDAPAEAIRIRSWTYQVSCDNWMSWKLQWKSASCLSARRTQIDNRRPKR